MNSTLSCELLNASYSKKSILKDITLNINSGEFVCLCGPNGCGKSTLLSLISNTQGNNLQLTSAKQKPCIDNKEITSFSQKKLAQKLSYLQQDEYSTWDFSVFDFVLTGRFCHTKNANYSQEDKSIVENTLELLEISSLKDKTVHNISGGEFQKVKLARTIVQSADFILMDEPSSSLDFVYEPKLLALLKEYAHNNNVGILVTIHDINLACRFADKIFLLKQNNPLICGTVEQVISKENIQNIFDCKCNIYNHQIFNCRQVTLL